MPVVFDRHFFAPNGLRRKIIFIVSRLLFIPGNTLGLSRATLARATTIACAGAVRCFSDESESPLFKVFRECIL